MKGEYCRKCWKLDFINGKCERHDEKLDQIMPHVYRRCAACVDADSAKKERKGTAIEFSGTPE